MCACIHICTCVYTYMIVYKHIRRYLYSRAREANLEKETWTFSSGTAAGGPTQGPNWPKQTRLSFFLFFLLTRTDRDKHFTVQEMRLTFQRNHVFAYWLVEMSSNTYIQTKLICQDGSYFRSESVKLRQLMFSQTFEA